MEHKIRVLSCKQRDIVAAVSFSSLLKNKYYDDDEDDGSLLGIITS